VTHPTISEQLIKIKQADLQLREKLNVEGRLSSGYNPEMRAVHEANADILGLIIDEISYPTIDKVGEDGSDAAWLIIQHAISRPNFMKKCLLLLETAVIERQAKPIHLAYLSDRIASFQELPQLYGTQFDWDENGIMKPKPYDDVNKVNERRSEIGLNSLEEQIEIIREQSSQENESPPDDYLQRKKAYDKWRKEVGWI
jgi:hypothetical protein